MKWFKQKRNIVFLILFVIITILYFCVPLFVMPDSAVYYGYLDIFRGIEPMSSWCVVRGPSLPTLVFIITSILGDNMLSILSLTYMFFAGFIISSYVFIEKGVEVFNINKEGRVIVFSLFYILIMFNPILFGYFHAFLTEFVAIWLGFIGCVTCWRWLSIDFSKEKGKYIYYNLIFVFLFVFSWFLKQPYVTVILFPLLISSLISVATKFTLVNVVQRLVTLMFTSLSLLGSIYLWNYFLKKSEVDIVHEFTTESFLSNSIIGGIGNLRFDSEEDVDPTEYLTDLYLSDKDRDQIEYIILNQDPRNFKVVRIIEPFWGTEEVVIDKMVFYYEGLAPSIRETVSFWFEIFSKHPRRVIESYYSNYLATINIFISWRDNKGFYHPISKVEDFHNENWSIGLSYLINEHNFLWIRDPIFGEVKNLYAFNNKDLLNNEVVQIFSSFHLIFFKLIFVSLPFLLIFSVIKCLYGLRKTDKKKKEYIQIVVIFLGFSFCHTLFHAVTGAIIDRYVYVVFPEIVLAVIILSILKMDRRENIKCKNF